MGKVLRKIKRGAKIVGSGVATVVGAAVGIELAYVGSTVLVEDIKTTAACIKEKKDPTPIKVKKGLFKKAEVVKVDPWTGKMSPYTGDKKPVNKKAIRIK